MAHVYASCGTSRSRGVAILISKHLQFKCIREVRDDEGRIMILLAEIQGHPVILANVYAPNKDHPTFFSKLEHKLSDIGDFPIVLGADFNQVMDPILDRNPPMPRPRRAINMLQNMCKTLGLVDTCIIHPLGTILFTPHPITHSHG